MSKTTRSCAATDLARMLLCSAVLACAATARAAAPLGPADAAAGEALFSRFCLSCHAGALPEAPQVDALALYPPGRIVESLTSGVMSSAGLSLSNAEMHQVAYFLTGKTVDDRAVAVALDVCEAPLRSSGEAEAAADSWRGWGGNTGGTRHQGGESRLSASNVARLELAWAFAFPEATRVRSQPTVTPAATYIGSQDGTVYALDTAAGCVHWTFSADNEVRGAPQLVRAGDRELLLFGDFKAQAYALDAVSGELLWKTRVHEHPLATITGSLAADGEHAYVPVSSSEVVPAALPDYPCCTFRGALVALDLADGALRWRSFTTDVPQSRGTNSVGTPQFGPSGAPIWSSPVVDERRGVVLVTTGQNYSSPATDTSDAVIAFDREDGSVRWKTQVTAGDAWNGACGRQTPNCPVEDGPDFDLGAGAALVTLEDGSQLIYAGQKSGELHALDPDADGALLWTQRVGSGGTMGGVHWGVSADTSRVYVGVSDAPTNNRYIVGDAQPGLHALDARSGEFIWRRVLPYQCPLALRRSCWNGVSAAVSSSPGLVFAGALDGWLRAFDAATGAVLWAFDTRRDFDAVNGVPARGGSIEADGPVVAGGRVFVTSGYDKWGEMPGNVLLVFALPGGGDAMAASEAAVTE